MNLLCDVSMFQSHHICFLDTKKNMVIDGFFTKIIYSDLSVSLNGLYILCPLESLSIPVFPLPSANTQSSHRFAGISSGSNYTRNHIVSTYQENGQTIITKKHPFMFSLTNPINIHFVKELNRIEHEIIEFYKDFFKINKVNVYSLRNQLKSGNIKAIQRIESNSTNMKKDNGPLGYSQRQPLNLKITKPQENSGQRATRVETPKGSLSEGHQQLTRQVTSLPNEFGEKYNFLSDTSPSLVIKISGIWETDVNVGITFKFQM